MKLCTCQICTEVVAKGGTACEITEPLRWTTKPDSWHPKDEKRFVVTAPGRAAGNIELEDGVRIEAGMNFNGSGSRAFGGAGSWPVVKVHVSLCEGDHARQVALIEHLKNALNDFYGQA